MTQGFITESLTTGLIRGVSHNEVDFFLGIPYGQTTAGAGRWRAATPSAPWAGVRDCLQFGHIAPQIDGRLYATGSWPQVADLMYPQGGSPIEGGTISEDCLVVNVWRPTAATGALPVMVWLHGGGYGHGAGSETIFSGDQIARTGRAIVVSVNHRLGILGHLELGGVLGEGYAGSGQLGLTDLVLALEWVHDNIAALGGDPSNVTIFGQSGGAAKVGSLLAMPAARGLFARAIMQSGPLAWFASPEQVEQTTTAVLDLLGLSRDQAGMLLDLPLDYLMHVQHLAESAGITWAPSVDGAVVAERPFADEGLEPWADVPLLIGSTSHELSLMLVSEPWYDVLDESTLVEAVAQIHGENAAQVVTRYTAEFPNDNPSLTFARVQTDASITRSVVKGAGIKSRQPGAVYAYRFAYETDAHDRKLGAAHSLDLPFVFGTVTRSPFAGQKLDRIEVSQRMLDAWVSFAETGSPATSSIPAWPPYDETDRSTMVIDSEWAVIAGPTLAELPAGASLWPDD
ncbi:MAG: carboxylesterase/lipase family protein [Microbacteriaceae bacterium]|jgi:para-nitrobenzyl esterase|nr:carboxylesterase/lipase family protein [Microbacteriaceae bacterium]